LTDFANSELAAKTQPESEFFFGPAPQGGRLPTWMLPGLPDDPLTSERKPTRNLPVNDKTEAGKKMEEINPLGPRMMKGPMSSAEQERLAQLSTWIVPAKEPTATLLATPKRSGEISVTNRFAHP